MTALLKVGISMRVTHALNYVEPRDSISHDWIRTLSVPRHIPILIPNDVSDLNDFLDATAPDLVVLTGGEDRANELKSENREDFLKRDTTELQLLQMAMTRNIPVLGVCRGLQLINYFFHGRETRLTSPHDHVSTHHEVSILGGTLSKIFPSHSFQVNSFHSKVILPGDLGAGLFACAQTADGQIEAAEHLVLPIVGIMWHPERPFQDLAIQSFHQNLFLTSLYDLLKRKNS